MAISSNTLIPKSDTGRWSDITRLGQSSWAERSASVYPEMEGETRYPGCRSWFDASVQIMEGKPLPIIREGYWLSVGGYAISIRRTCYSSFKPSQPDSNSSEWWQEMVRYQYSSPLASWEVYHHTRPIASRRWVSKFAHHNYSICFTSFITAFTKYHPLDTSG